MFGTPVEARSRLALVPGLVVVAFFAAFVLGTLDRAPVDVARHGGSLSTPPIAAPPNLGSNGTLWATRDFPKTADGLTYGSDIRADSRREAPDLVAVIGDSGVAGFVRKTDLYEPVFHSPRQALQWQHRVRLHGGRIVMDVVDLDGNVVDTFTQRRGVTNHGPPLAST